jgi:hypothetical protein
LAGPEQQVLLEALPMETHTMHKDSTRGEVRIVEERDPELAERQDAESRSLVADNGKDLEQMFEMFAASDKADDERVVAAWAKIHRNVMTKCPSGHCIRYSEDTGYSAPDVEQDVAEKLFRHIRHGGLVFEADSFARTSVRSVVGTDWRRINERRSRVAMIQGGGFIEETCAEDDDSLSVYERKEDVGNE